MNLLKSLQFFSSAIVVAAIAIQLASPDVVAEDAKPEAAKTVEVKASDLTLNVPSTWKQQQPSNNLRLAQFVIPAPKEGVEAGELVVSGPFGGSAAQNIERWLGQFQAEGRQAKMTQGESTQGQYIIVDMTGTYNRSVGPPFRRQTEAVADYQVINVMITVKAGRGGNYFLKLAGPKEAIQGVAEQLRASFGGDSGKETPYEL